MSFFTTSSATVEVWKSSFKLPLLSVLFFFFFPVATLSPRNRNVESLETERTLTQHTHTPLEPKHMISMESNRISADRWQKHGNRIWWKRSSVSFTDLVNRSWSLGVGSNKYPPHTHLAVEQLGARQRWRAKHSDCLWLYVLSISVSLLPPCSLTSLSLHYSYSSMAKTPSNGEDKRASELPGAGGWSYRCSRNLPRRNRG